MYDGDPNADRPMVIFICVLFGLFVLFALVMAFIETSGILSS